MRLKLLVAYDGSARAGWQSQVGGNTIQDILEAAIAGIQGAPVTVHGSGRTDARVHALGQCAHVDVANQMTPAQWFRALNAKLPPDIRIMKASAATAKFHARFSAAGKIYRYTIWNGPVLPPLEVNRAWHVHGPVDMEKLRAASALFVGRHDFGAFCANRGTPDENTCRTIHSIRATRKGPRISLTFEGEGFLYKMIRILTSAIVRASLGAQSLESLQEMLSAGKGAKFHHVAPAGGLCLVRVLY